nr:hypothetical protein [Micromonospora sp. DSM 115978]
MVVGQFAQNVAVRDFENDLEAAFAPAAEEVARAVAACLDVTPHRPPTEVLT